MTKAIKITAWLAAILGLSVVALYYTVPTLMLIPDNDYSIFQYIGEGIRQGELPYRDRYDHKPPSIFYLNALGLTLGGGSRWGIWAFELASLTAAGCFGAAFLKRYFGALPAALATAGFLLNLTYFHQGGNLTEEYALPLQFAALWLLSRWETSPKPGRAALGIGLLASCASTFKQPLGAMLAAAGVCMLIQRQMGQNTPVLPDLLWLAVGFTIPWLGWGAYFAVRSAWQDFWAGAFAYNFALSSISTAERVTSFANAILVLFRQSPFFLFGLLAWIASLPFLVLNDERIRQVISRSWLGWGVTALGLAGVYNGLFRRGLTLYTPADIGGYQLGLISLGLGFLAAGLIWNLRGGRQRLYRWLSAAQPATKSPVFLPLLFAIIDLPVQIGMISLSGDNFGHYFMATFPSITILTAFFFWYLLTELRASGRFTMAYVWLGVFAIPLLAPGAVESIHKIHLSEDRRTKMIADYVRSNTSVEDTIFYWGNYAMLYTTSQRNSPSRFFVISSLFLKGYTGQREAQIFLSELQAHPPRLIIGSGGASRPLLYLTKSRDCDRLLEEDFAQQMAEQKYQEKIFIPQGMPAVYAWICKNYVRTSVALSEDDSGKWVIFRYAPNRSP